MRIIFAALLLSGCTLSVKDSSPPTTGFNSNQAFAGLVWEQTSAADRTTLCLAYKADPDATRQAFLASESGVDGPGLWVEIVKLIAKVSC